MTTSNTVLAFDFGKQRIGVAVGQSITGTASPLKALSAVGEKQLWEKIRQLIAEWRPQQLLVGLPLHADGREGSLATEIRGFAALLQQHSGLPVNLHDEHLSSAEAQMQLRAQRQSGERKRKVAKGDIDSVAAAVILQSWLIQQKPGDSHNKNQPSD